MGKMDGEITASLGLTREDVRQALIEAGISPTTRRMEDAINYIRVTVRDWAAPASQNTQRNTLTMCHLKREIGTEGTYCALVSLQKGEKAVIQVGARVQTITIVDRRPLFEVPPGKFGTVVRAERDFIVVQMDERIEGCEEWSNQVRFIPDDCGEYWWQTRLDTVEKVFYYHFCFTGEMVAGTSREQLTRRYKVLLKNEESYEQDTPTEIIRGVLKALERGEGPEHFRHERDVNQQHMDEAYFQSVTWVWNDAIRVVEVERRIDQM